MISKNQIKYITSLHSKKNRLEDGHFIVEGVKLVLEFISDPIVNVKEVFATANFIHNNKMILATHNIFYTEITEDELKKISLLTAPNQVLAVVEEQKPILNRELLYTGLTLFLDDIRDPGNLGTIIRIADWFGIKQVICSTTTTELYNPKTLQASMGAVLRVSVLYMNFKDFLSYAKTLPIYGAVLNGETIYKSKLEKGIIVIGNEANGISLDVLNYINKPITIPAAVNNGSESLNAANACAIICGEFYRQLYL